MPLTPPTPHPRPSRPGRPRKYSPDEMAKAVRLAREHGSLREAAAITGIGISAIRLAARAQQPDPHTTAWVHHIAAQILDGIDLTPLALEAGHDPHTATTDLHHLVDTLRRKAHP